MNKRIRLYDTKIGDKLLFCGKEVWVTDKRSGTVLGYWDNAGVFNWINVCDSMEDTIVELLEEGMKI